MSGHQQQPASSGDASPAPDDRAAWVKRVLGQDVSFRRVRFAPPPGMTAAPPPLPGAGRRRAGRRPAIALQSGGPAQHVGVGGGRALDISKGADGRIVLKAPPPPIAEITFSGGGGKGAALPGAVAALYPIMQGVSVVKGASVGSLTASLVAAGLDPEQFRAVADDPATTARILENRAQGGKMALARGLMGKLSLGDGPLSGQGLYSVVRETMDKAILKRTKAYLDSLPAEIRAMLDSDESDHGQSESDDDAIPANPSQPTAPDGTPIALLRQVKGIQQKISSGERGVTFSDLRTLHKLFPEIKEVEISATLMGDSATPAQRADELLQPGEAAPAHPLITAGKAQAAMFNAETQPDMEVAKACQASAALPPVFSPVDIELEGGIWGRFIDGGVMNNAPSSQTVQSKRDVDPMKPSGSLTYTFQSPDDEEDQHLLSGTPKPGQSGFVDKTLVGAPHTAAEYARARLLADAPEDIVVVPLKFKVMGKDGKQKRNWYGTKKEEDFSTLLGGTINFNISDKSKLVLQQMTFEATDKHLQKRQEPKTSEFASARQTLNCISASDLAGLAAADFEGARQEQAFRNAALGLISDLRALQDAAPDQKRSGGLDLLQSLDALTEGDVDRVGFVARELSRNGDLDDFLKALQSDAADVPEVLQAGVAVAEVFDAKAHALNALREIIYPRMTEQNTKAENALLRQVDDRLRSAESKDDVNQALQLAIDTFNNAKVGRGEKQKFAAELVPYLLK